VRLVSHKESIDTKTPTGRLMLTVIVAINSFERENLLERQCEGIKIAMDVGKYKGSKAVSINDFDNHYQRYISREVSIFKLTKELKISHPTLDKLL
jgi:DNA invertase Pin-like site-specific DNA recombinase